MSDSSRTRLALEFMAEALADLDTPTRSMRRHDFLADRLTQRTVERCLEVISEASCRLPEELKAAHPEIPRRKVAGIGNILRHDDDEVDAGVIWQAATVEIVPLRAAVAAMLAEIARKYEAFDPRVTRVWHAAQVRHRRNAPAATTTKMPEGSKGMIIIPLLFFLFFIPRSLDDRHHPLFSLTRPPFPIRPLRPRPPAGGAPSPAFAILAEDHEFSANTLD